MYNKLYSDIVGVIKDAGKIMLNAHMDADSIYEKEGLANFVTKYDKEVQNHLISNFKTLLPEANYLAEEDDITTNLHEGYCFIIDPIDGTTNFIFDCKCSCISVALTFQGEVEFAVVYLPYIDECYTSAKGQGAYVNDRRIYASKKGLDENIVAFGCARYHENETERIFRYAKALYLNSLDVRNVGAAAIDLCRIASGSNGAYIALLLQPWDYAAASLIISEAGGKITQPDGSAITLSTPCGVLAGGLKCHEDSMRIMGELDRGTK